MHLSEEIILTKHKVCVYVCWGKGQGDLDKLQKMNCLTVSGAQGHMELLWCLGLGAQAHLL